MRACLRVAVCVWGPLASDYLLPSAAAAASATVFALATVRACVCVALCVCVLILQSMAFTTTIARPVLVFKLPFCYCLA